MGEISKEAWCVIVETIIKYHELFASENVFRLQCY